MTRKKNKKEQRKDGRGKMIRNKEKNNERHSEGEGIKNEDRRRKTDVKATHTVDAK
jgi:hypothetical protein